MTLIRPICAKQRVISANLVTIPNFMSEQSAFIGRAYYENYSFLDIARPLYWHDFQPAPSATTITVYQLVDSCGIGTQSYFRSSSHPSGLFT